MPHVSNLFFFFVARIYVSKLDEYSKCLYCLIAGLLGWEPERPQASLKICSCPSRKQRYWVYSAQQHQESLFFFCFQHLQTKPNQTKYCGYTKILVWSQFKQCFLCVNLWLYLDFGYTKILVWLTLAMNQTTPKITIIRPYWSNNVRASLDWRNFIWKNGGIIFLWGLILFILVEHKDHYSFPMFSYKKCKKKKMSSH